eukprot:TRINITY_DN61117_c0_g1_i1.p1 TRINITY_DN61117_c0_g1~~TRINITY_DN61117_c0_g1_i1.p1  ORF type:complete len:118 (+),score=5.03 TRINITY_DN61117_c0_g1_i1:2-355(+)
MRKIHRADDRICWIALKKRVIAQHDYFLCQVNKASILFLWEIFAHDFGKIDAEQDFRIGAQVKSVTQNAGGIVHQAIAWNHMDICLSGKISHYFMENFFQLKIWLVIIVLFLSLIHI